MIIEQLDTTFDFVEALASPNLRADVKDVHNPRIDGFVF